MSNRLDLILQLSSQTTLPVLENSFNQRINAIIGKIREMRRAVYWPHLYVVKEDGEPALRMWALSCLIEDRTDGLPSYREYLETLRNKVSLLQRLSGRGLPEGFIRSIALNIVPRRSFANLFIPLTPFSLSLRNLCTHLLTSLSLACAHPSSF